MDSQAYLHTIEPLFSFIKGVIVEYFRFISMPAGFAAMLQVSSDKCLVLYDIALISIVSKLMIIFLNKLIQLF